MGSISKSTEYTRYFIILPTALAGMVGSSSSSSSSIFVDYHVVVRSNVNSYTIHIGLYKVQIKCHILTVSNIIHANQLLIGLG